MTHGRRDDVKCTGTWPITGRPCLHLPVDESGRCAAHHPDGDRRRPPRPNAERCTGTCKESGERCRKRRIDGGTVCDLHGGSAGQVKKAAKKRADTQEARRIVETYGLPITVSPQDAILAEVHRTAGHVAWLADQVRDLSRDELIWGTTKIVIGGREEGETQEAAPHALLVLYKDERAHLVRVCAAALRAGIEERQVKLAEQQGALLVDLIKGILDDLKLTPEQKAMIPIVVPQHLRALQTAAPTN